MSKTFSIAFYNLENLFDPLETTKTLDRDFTPNGRYSWSEDKYQKKITNLSKTIAKIGLTRCDTPPILIGVCEVENETCLNDLVQSSSLKSFGYGFVFHESPDRRGIHVALLYQKSHFTVEKNTPISVGYSNDQEIEGTRDILHIKGRLFKQSVNLIINHWPSRSDGTKSTEHKRLNASKEVQGVIDKINRSEQEAKIIVMGDFNDEPSSGSLSPILDQGFENPMLEFQKLKKGSVKFKGKWIMFDQILFNHHLKKSTQFEYLSTQIYVEPSLIQKSGKHRGSPKRTFNGSYYLGGYSDHFPVFTYFNLLES
ncbi:endonuclease [Lutimonas sp.]|uniref:endonuclease/exonuclease/phosphatase family protein n=1 Tax=Lutimonas sp. TaxID=1872403 RepID=UPI003D9BBFD4